MRRRTFHFALTLLLTAASLVGCSNVKTAGVYNRDLNEKQPYVFNYDGPVQKAAVSLRNALLPTGFSPTSQDEYEGGASFVFTKTLSDDEKFVTKEYYEQETGVYTGEQKGKLIFLLSEGEEGATTVQMTSRLTVTVKQEANAFKTQEEQAESQVSQGHPLPMKYGRKFAEMPGWSLRSPSRTAVFKTDEAESETEGVVAQSAADEQNVKAADSGPAAGGGATPSPTASSGGDSSGASSAASERKRPGDDGNDTAWVQRTLNELGMDCGTADGVMGPNTRACIRSFQKANGLEATGEIDEATYRLMLERL